MKKILINFLYWGSKTSGIYRAGFNIIKEIVNICEEKLYCITNYYDEINFDNIEVIPMDFKTKTKVLKALEAQIYLLETINKLKPDLIFNPFHFGLFFKKVPQISIIYDLISLTVPIGRIDTYIYHKFLLQKLLNRCKFVITPSNTTKNDIIKIFDLKEDKIKVVYLGIDKEKFKPLNLPKENFYLIVNATFPYKNVDYVIKIWKKFDIKEKLIIVGYHPKFIKYHNYLKDLAKKFNLEDRIIFYKNVSDEELIELYNKALALISPSLKEGFGLPPLEALSCKIPVILSNIPVYREIYNEIGIFFDLNNEESFLSALEKLKNLNKDEFEEKRNEFIKKIDWEKSAEEIYKIIKDAL